MTVLAAAWPEIRIGDLGEVFTGRTPPTERRSLFGQDFPFITPGDMHQGKYARATERHLSHEGASLLRRIQLPANSVCVSCIGWQMGEVIMTDRPSFTNQQINTIVPDGKVDPSFLYYALLPRKKELLSRGSGTGVRTPILNKSAFCDLKVKIPQILLQRRVADILSTYDDLVEINRRRIALLDEIAQRLFEEWFVRFRFPGYERHKIIEAADGRCPQGWQFRKVGEMTSFLSRGISPQYDETAGTLVIGQKCIRDRRLSLAPARKQSRPVQSEKVVRPGDVLINSTGVGTLGRVAQAEATAEGLTVDSHVTIVRHRTDVDRDFFGLALLRLEPSFERLGTGATNQTELNRSRIADAILLEPPADLQTAFGRHARPLRRLAFQLDKQNEALAFSRDLLLPRLISGELSVSTDDRELETAA